MQTEQTDPTVETTQPPTVELARPARDVDPRSQLRTQMRVAGEQSKALGTVDALEHNPATGQLAALTVRHGLLGRKRTRVPAELIKQVNQDSVVLRFSSAEFKRLPRVAGG